MAQLVRAPPCHGGGHGFESRLGRCYSADNLNNGTLSLSVREKTLFLSGILAQLGEHLPYKQRVTGSSPVGPIDVSNYPMQGMVHRNKICYMPQWRNWQTPRT